MLVTGDFTYNDIMQRDLLTLQLDRPFRTCSLLHCDNTCYEKANYATQTLVLLNVVNKS